MSDRHDNWVSPRIQAATAAHRKTLASMGEWAETAAMRAAIAAADASEPGDKHDNWVSPRIQAATAAHRKTIATMGEWAETAAMRAAIAAADASEPGDKHDIATLVRAARTGLGELFEHGIEHSPLYDALLPFRDIPDA